MQEMQEVTKALQTASESARTELGKAREAMEKATADMNEVRTAAEAAAQAIPEAPNGDGWETSTSYASAAKRAPPPQATLDRMAKRKTEVIIDVPAGETRELTEEQLVTKANLALELADTEGLPEGAKFKNVRKIRNGGLLYSLNSAEAADWIRVPANKKKVLDKFGSEATISEQGYTVKVQWVSTAYSPDGLAEKENIARNNDLPPTAILGVHWMKEPTKRRDGQKTAHLLVRFEDPKSANKAIKEGLTLMGRGYEACRLLKEIQRCMKCQKWGNHYAGECKDDHDTCATCGSGEHRTGNCTHLGDKSKYFCCNCNRAGHAAWSRTCETFQEKNKQYQQKFQENAYRYFLTEDPSTWETTDGRNEKYTPGEKRAPGEKNGPTGREWLSREEAERRKAGMQNGRRQNERGREQDRTNDRGRAGPSNSRAPSTRRQTNLEEGGFTTKWPVHSQRSWGDAMVETPVDYNWLDDDNEEPYRPSQRPTRRPEGFTDADLDYMRLNGR